MHPERVTLPISRVRSTPTRGLLPALASCRTLLLVLWGPVGGCATLDVVELDHPSLTENARPVAHIRGSNWGWYLFKFIPVVTGNLERPEYPQWPRFFQDNVTSDHVVGLVTMKSEELGGTLTTDLRSTDKSAWQPWSLIFWLNEIEVSANASLPPDAAADRRGLPPQLPRGVP